MQNQVAFTTMSVFLTLNNFCEQSCMAMSLLKSKGLEIRSLNMGDTSATIDERILERPDVQKVIEEIQVEFMQTLIEIMLHHVKGMADSMVTSIEKDEITREKDGLKKNGS
ncbi:unnamed protein product [Allacma fusca]|uniref:Uncharacterized protein n=1 Tax=Allacma fusca TaxID=39272 RepID=A0A8J2LKF1_9HEXA|nr:unnamed protein product [Allacma fusca]